MTDIHEEDVAEQIDQQVMSKGGLVALVMCLSVTVGLAAAGVAALVGVF